jgi:hypothetical protein
MRNFIKFPALGCVLIFGMTACNKQIIDTPVTPIDTEIVKHQLELSTKNWNERMGSVVMLKSYKDVDVIDTEAKRTALIDELVSPLAFAAHGDVLEAQTVRLEQLSNLFVNNPDAIAALKTAIGNQIHVGDKVMEITWAKGEHPFTTKCIVNQTGIVWDNILHGVYMGQPATEFTSIERVTPTSAVKNYQWNQSVNWIWGAKRGQMDYTMRIHYTDEIVTSTTVDASAGMNSGTTFKQSSVIFSQGTQGTAKIALGLATPTTVLTFDENTFAVNGVGTKVFNITKTLYPE